MAGPDDLKLDELGAIPDPLHGMAARHSPTPPPHLPPSPTRQQRQRRVLLSFVLAAGWMALVLRMLGLRRDISSSEVLSTLGIWAAVAALSLFLSRRRQRGLPADATTIHILLVALPAAYVLGALLQSTWSAAPESASWGGACAMTSIAMSAGFLLLASLVAHRAFLTMPIRRGALFGALAGLGGAIGIHAHCAMPGSAHVLVGHGAAVVVGALFGGIFGALRGRA